MVAWGTYDVLPPSLRRLEFPSDEEEQEEEEEETQNRLSHITHCSFLLLFPLASQDLNYSQVVFNTSLHLNITGTFILTLNVLYHTIPHELCGCEAKAVHGLQSFVLTHSEESDSVLFTLCLQ